MGYYINPPDMSKEAWLMTHGFMQRETPSQYVDGNGNVVVCLVNNPGFTAAAIAFSQDELSEFNLPHDRRAKIWFTVPIAKLTPEVCGCDMSEVIA